MYQKKLLEIFETIMFVPTIYIENSNENMSVEVSDKKLHHLNQVLRLRDGDKLIYPMEKDASLMEILLIIV